MNKVKITKSSGNIFEDMGMKKDCEPIMPEKISNATYISLILGRNGSRKIRPVQPWPDKARVIQRKNGLLILHGDGKYIICNDYEYYGSKP